MFELLSYTRWMGLESLYKKEICSANNKLVKVSIEKYAPNQTKNCEHTTHVPLLNGRAKPAILSTLSH